MIDILKKMVIFLILNFVITQEDSFSCLKNETFNFNNITKIKFAKKNLKFLDQILKKHENDTIDLILSSLDIEHLRDIIINNYYINKIDLSDNIIKVIPEDFFSRLKFIKEINFHGNGFIWNLTSFYRNIEKNICAFLYLEKLDFGFNDISSIDGNNFDKLKNLKYLNLEFNNFINLFDYSSFKQSLSAFDLNKFNQVEELKLGDSKIINDKDFSFKIFSNLKSLDIKFCEFKILNSKLFAGLKNLSNLVVNGINIGNLTENIFFELENLKSLSIRSVVGNREKFLNIFSYIPDSLEFLDISVNNLISNELISLDDLKLNKFSKLKTLISISNNIRQINRTAFHEMNELQFVDLSLNKIDSLNFDLFFKGNKIEVFYISYGGIKTVEFDFFKEAKMLKTLWLNQNSIDLFQICFSCMINLTKIYFGFNKIFKIPNFNKNINLVYIGLYSNNIQTIQSNAFYNLSKLKIIELGGNPIKIIEQNAFYNCKNIQKIFLPINNLGKESLLYFLNTLNTLVVERRNGLNYFKTIFIIKTDKIDQRLCFLIIYFLRYRIFIIQEDLLKDINYISLQKEWEYNIEESTIEYFMNKCSDFNN